ncbi:hypothetical protein HNR37_000307 [Desulfurispira natronophila]|uniref:Uncharacterized protein n=1 Tax=Desulfurispira natronophila TaxID=682562 RepID=A0A7W7Y2U3_9BACT|nr:hypothetical protein [Desulfurispira natronophila]
MLTQVRKSTNFQRSKVIETEISNHHTILQYHTMSDITDQG